jgi:hypothetical protein
MFPLYQYINCSCQCGKCGIITEHQFGTFKRQRGYTYTNIRGKDKVLGEVGILNTEQAIVQIKNTFVNISISFLFLLLPSVYSESVSIGIVSGKNAGLYGICINGIGGGKNDSGVFPSG